MTSSRAHVPTACALRQDMWAKFREPEIELPINTTVQFQIVDLDLNCIYVIVAHRVN